MSNQPRVLVVTYDVIGPKMAGPGIRAWEFARVLGRTFPTTLAAPPPLPAEAPGFALAPLPLEQIEQRALQDLIAAHDIVVAQTLPLDLLPDDVFASEDKYFVVDLYCPWLIENLEHYRLAEATNADWLIHDLQTMSALFMAGDFFVCAGDAQRAYWLGALSLFGRLTEAIYREDADGRTLIDIVPFGLAAEPPRRTAPALKGVIPGIGPEDFVALWGGGVWNWLDPLTLIRATARLRDRGYPIRSFFLGTQRPSVSAAAAINPAMIDLARVLSDDLGLTGTHVFFNDRWVPYAERANFLLEADAGISLHQRTLETRFAFRTRVLDYLWAGLVPVVNDGDTIAALVRSHDVGHVVAIGDDAALAETLAGMMERPDERRARADRCRELARSYTWEVVAQPIVDYCHHPRKPVAGARAAHVAIYDEMKALRHLAGETTGYAERLEREIAARDHHIARTTRYVQELEQRVAHPSLRSFAATRLRTTSLRGMAAAVRRRLSGK